MAIIRNRTNCEKEFIARSGRNTKQCSKICRNKNKVKPEFDPRLLGTCQYCKKTFVAKRARSIPKFCSQTCISLSKKVVNIKICPICNIDYNDDKSRKKYCSIKCANEAQIKKITVECQQCQKYFETWPTKIKTRKYCSMECKKEGVKHNIRHNCLCCGTSFMTIRSQMKKYCSRICFGKHKCLDIDKECVVCNQIFKPKFNHHVSCSAKCAAIYNNKHQKPLIISLNQALEQQNETEFTDCQIENIFKL